MHFNLRLPDATSVLIYFNYDTHAKSLYLTYPLLSYGIVTANTLRYAVTLTFDLKYRVGQKTDHFLKRITLLYNDIGRHSIYQYVQLFIKSRNDILNAGIFKYSLHEVRETILHWKY